MKQCDFYMTTHNRCESKDTRFIHSANWNLCHEHVLRCKRSETEWEEAGKIQPTFQEVKTEETEPDVMNHPGTTGGTDAERLSPTTEHPRPETIKENLIWQQ